ncbi:hypothetical protein B6U99_03850 [Candidatus Geothermarchaeota archaeon ex4572_27]|nr:MAG: hypothetical protein B6U99_03850 [Candidatus Geothermarchaeota archaeon ex4572_27]
MGGEVVGEARRRLLGRDCFFSRCEMLDEDIRERENVFVANSIRGMLGYLLEKEGGFRVSRPS